jgi:hypothetical protein
VQRGWKVGLSALVAVASLALGGCSEDAEAVTQDAYDAEAERLCERHGEALISIDELDARPDSDAAKAAFLAGELVPAARSVVRSLDGFGYPPAKAAEYGNAAVAAFEALAEMQEDAIGLLDRRRAGLIVEGEDPFADLTAALAAMDIPC